MSHPSINPFSLWEDLKNYTFSAFRFDIVASFSVALLALPQSIAYALVAGLPPSAGIWAAVFGTLFTASFGESRFLISGPTNVIAILIQSGTSEILFTHFRDATGAERDFLAIRIILQIVLTIGIFQIIAGWLRLGRITQFTSRSVIVGYISGAALAIVIVQIFSFFGVPKPSGFQPLYSQALYFFSHIYLLHLPTTLVAVGSLFLLIILYRISSKIPAPAIVLTLAALFVFAFNLSPANAKGSFEVASEEMIEKVTLLESVGPLFSELPKLKLPSLDMRILSNIIPLAFAIALFSVLEATSIGRSYSKAKDPPYHDNQEIYALGVSNFLSSFLAAMPSSGSFSRTALNYSLKAKTRFSAIFSGILVFVFVALLGFAVAKIPIAALSALLMYTAYTMVNFKNLFICLKATKSDAAVVLTTFISSLLFALDVALYLGVAVSIVLYLKQAAIPRLIEYAFNNIGKLRPIDPEDDRPDPRICILQAEGNLFFGAADVLQTKLRRISEDENLKIIILQLLNTRHLDASSCLAIKQVLAYLKGTERFFMLSGVSKTVWEILERSGLLKEIGENHCFRMNPRLPSEPTRSAYAEAKKLLSTI